MPSVLNPFTASSGPSEPRLEFAFEIQLSFASSDTIPDLPSGYGRGLVLLSGGTITGPLLNGVVESNSGADYAMFRPDDVVSTDAHYILDADDGDRILMHNRGFLWGRRPDTMQRMRAWMFENGEPLEFDEFYLRASPSFETPKGAHEWMMRHIFVGIGQRQQQGNTIRYYALL